jgi:hypothetical protein
VENNDETVLPCAEKLAFDNKKDADATANVAHYRYGSRVHSYKCRHCGLWHLSSGAADD